MAISNSTDFTVTRDEIIESASRICGIYDANDTISTAETNDAAYSLNCIVKELMSEMNGMWLRREVTLFLADGQQSYSLGPTGDNAAINPTVTALAAAANSGDSTIDVDSITGISNGDNIGIKLDSGAIQWTTVNGAPSGSTVTLTATLDGDAAIDNAVYAYTSKPDRPQKILWGIARYNSGIDVEMTAIRRDEYLYQSQKDTDSVPTMYCYEPTLSNGTVYIWPVSNDDVDRVVFLVEDIVSDFDTSTDNPEFPVEWFNTLNYMLAADLADQHGLPLQERQYIRTVAERKKQTLMMYDQDNAPIRFSMDYEGRGYDR